MNQPVGEKIIQAIENISGFQLQTETASKNTFLLHQGEVEKYIYYISSGAVKAVYQSNEEEHTIRFGYKGSIITSVQSILQNKPSSFSIETIRKTQLIRIPADLFFKSKKVDPELKIIYDNLIENLIIQQLEREIDILTSSPLERFQRVWERSPLLFQEIPSKYIASYLRMTPETLSRIRKS
ncbi:MAG: Crp/Fnr family transcriptional regulator [Bacteroidia bacterium]